MTPPESILGLNEICREKNMEKYLFPHPVSLQPGKTKLFTWIA